MNIKKWCLIIIAILIFGFGMYFSTLKNDSNALKDVKKLNIESKSNQLKLKDKSAELETKLQKVKAYDRQTYKQTQAISNAVDSHCFSSDFVELYNKQTEKYERILSGKHPD